MQPRAVESRSDRRKKVGLTRRPPHRRTATRPRKTGGLLPLHGPGVLTLLTGSLFAAGSGLIYEPRPALAARFLQAFIKQRRTHVWWMRLGFGGRSLTEELLRAWARRSRRRRYAGTERLARPQRIDTAGLLRLLPVLIRLCHREQLLSVQVRSLTDGGYFTICDHGDLLLRARRGADREASLRLAQRIGLRVAPPGYWGRLVMDRAAFRANLRAGCVKPCRVGRRNLGVCPRELLKPARPLP